MQEEPSTSAADVEMEDDNVARSEATFRFDVPDLKNLKDRVLSPACYVRNMLFKIMVEKKDYKQKEKGLGVYLFCNNRSESSTWACSAAVVFKLLNHKPDKKPLQRKLQRIFDSKVTNWGFEDFILWSVVLNPEEGYMKDDGITLEAYVTAEAPYGLSWGSKNNIVALTLSACDFRALLNDSTFADITIVASDRVRRAAHKQVLVARSKVFHAMFRNDMSEVKTSELRMDDINGKVLDDFLQYLYSGCISEGYLSNPEAMLMLSDKYDLPALKLLTQEYLHKQLSLETAAHTLLLAIKYDALYLKRFTLICIQEQGVTEVMNTDSWKKLDNNDILKNSAAIMEFIYIISKSEEVSCS